jgi:amidase
MTQQHDTHGSIFTETLDLGSAQGLTVAVKDCIDIAGHPTRCGSAAFDNAPPARKNAAVIAQLLASGCRIIGKTTMHELAYGMTGVNAHSGTPINPRWPYLIPGGSSSGSAVAVAAGLVDFAIGTDTGGSIRQPAVCCGVIGMKPTFGRVDRSGATPAASSLDCIGPLARRMDALERAMAAIDPSFVAVPRRDTPPRVARLRLANGEASTAWSAPLLGTDLTVTDVELPLLNDAFRAGMIVIARETHGAFGHLLAENAPLGEDVLARLRAAAAVTDDELAWAEDIRVRFTAEVDAVLSDHDVLITPALPFPPPRLDEAQDPQRVLPLTRYLRPFNLSGHPAIVLPATDDSGLPTGLQIVGRAFDDPQLCAIASWFSAAAPKLQAKD